MPDLTPDPHEDILSSLHPDCPDWRRLGPTADDAKVRAAAHAVRADLEQRESMWSKGFTRRRLLKGGLGVGVAAVGAQLVTTRVSYAAPGTPAAEAGTLVVVFLRGGMDGLSVLVPGNDPFLQAARPGILVQDSALIPLGRGFGLHPALAPLQPLIAAGQLAAVPAVSTPDLSRSHFQAQDCLERGGVASSTVRTGWLDRVLTASGPGTTFRAIALGPRTPRSVASSGAIAFEALTRLTLDGYDKVKPASLKAIGELYTGIDNPIAVQAQLSLSAIDTAAALGQQPPSDVTYPGGGFASSLRDVASLIKSDQGVRVACIDLGGWDMHTGIGTVEDGDMKNALTGVAAALAAFTADLGTHLAKTTIVTMSEFGRRIEQNASGGTDHGHGNVALIMGGGVNGGVRGVWQGLDPAVRDNGDVPGTNDYRAFLGEVVTKRLGISADGLATVFPGAPAPDLGVMT